MGRRATTMYARVIHPRKRGYSDGSKMLYDINYLLVDTIVIG